MTITQTDELLVTQDGDVVTAVFNRPHRRNAFTLGMYGALHDLFHRLADDDTARVVILRGAGSVDFAAGNEVSEFAQLGSTEEILTHERGFREMCQALDAIPQVSIAAVDGLCVGGGLAVASFCDLRLATSRSRFGYPLARTLGNVLSSPLLERCLLVFGEPLTKEMLLSSHLIDADRAYSVGAIAHVADSAEALDAEVARIAHAIDESSPVTIAATKQQLAKLTAYEGDLERDTGILERVYGSDGFREGVRAFLAKEKPHFPPGPTF